MPPPIDDFFAALAAAVAPFKPPTGRPPDAAQDACIRHDPAIPLQIVAGPGSGKTTVLVLRALRLVVVDRLLPEQILITTFTRKAAEEVRSRLIEWGIPLMQHLAASHGAHAAHVAHVDVNRFVTGTLDAICEDVLSSSRAPTDPSPVLIEQFAANNLMHRHGLTGRAYLSNSTPPIKADVAAYLKSLNGGEPRNVAELIAGVRPLFDRFAHDAIDKVKYRGAGTHTTARDLLVASYDAYVQHLQAEHRLDFALLEQLFLERLRQKRLIRFTQSLRAILVDEYQDTNLLQESIYFELVAQSKASLTVVGDDDQSLYRFRGATVELFRDFAPRLQQAIGAAPEREDLSNNYRSTPEIVRFCNTFIGNDPAFAGARIQPQKPLIQPIRPSNGAPVLGMFRADVGTLARDLASFVHDVFRGKGYKPQGLNTNIVCSPNGGDVGDAVFLGYTANEYARAFMGQPPRIRLPRLLRQELNARGINVFNPRGQRLRDIAPIQRCIGAMLECLDPSSRIQTLMNLRNEAKNYLQTFRDAYTAFVTTNPAPTKPQGLDGFVKAWGRRQSQGPTSWPREWPVLELFFTLVAWFPSLRDDPEGQVHTEALARAISQAAGFSPYRAQIIHNSAPHDDRSVQSAIRDIFAPLAENQIDVDEDIVASVPRDRFAMMTIHQAKGLEFPLVVVDVSSDFKTNNKEQRRNRFPDEPSSVALSEDDVASACAIGGLRGMRTALERTFEDLIRLYFVAYSRPQSVLLLVGLDKTIAYKSTIRHVGSFWRADGTWAWQAPHPGRKPPATVNNHPLVLI